MTSIKKWVSKEMKLVQVKDEFAQLSHGTDTQAWFRKQ